MNHVIGQDYYQINYSPFLSALFYATTHHRCYWNCYQQVSNCVKPRCKWAYISMNFPGDFHFVARKAQILMLPSPLTVGQTQTKIESSHPLHQDFFQREISEEAASFQKGMRVRARRQSSLAAAKKNEDDARDFGRFPLGSKTFEGGLLLPMQFLPAVLNKET